mgnify:CR=1 FL=1
MIDIPEGSIAIINQAAPHGSAKGQESLELALAMSNFGQEVSLFFVEDGIWQLINHQAPQQIDSKAYHKTFAALEFYEIDNIFVCRQSLFERTETPQLLNKHAQVMVF